MDLFVNARCVIFLSSVVFLSESFNIDVKNAVVHQGSNGTAFGYTAEFIQNANKSTRLLVGAPKTVVTDRDTSGIHYYCFPDMASACVKDTSPPEPNFQREGRFSEDSELFGLAMALANKTTAVVCGPMWSDLKYWYRNFIFNVGRCKVLSGTHDNRPGVLPYFNSEGKDYTADISVSGRTTRQMQYGAAEFGFSADSDGSGKIVFGAPGFSVSRGGVVVFDVETTLYYRMETILAQEQDSVLGYDVAAGNFCGSKRFCFAVSNKQIKGKVYLIEHAVGSRVEFRVLWSAQGKQAYSSFGSVLCATDVTGDGWPDLLVGAPVHTATLNESLSNDESLSYDEGRVFVYISHGEAISGDVNFDMAVTLAGDHIPFARFGSAISSIGDINRDSLNDIAVGAPEEEGGAGALYIYLGSPSGPSTKYSQKIRGNEFEPSLSSFGSHISKPTSDLSLYGYPDFAVGAPESDAVVFLKTRLIVNAEVRVKATPNPVDPENQVCPRSMARGFGCLNVSLCLNYTYKVSEDSSGSAHDYVGFDVSLELDKLISSDSSRRIRLQGSSDNSFVTVFRTSITVPRNKGVCQQYLAILNQDQIDRNPFVPVHLYANFSLNMTSFSGTVAPILNQSMPDSHTEQVKFKNKCGEDNVCETNLVLTGRVQHVPAEDSHPTLNVVNRTTQVELVLDLVNRGETSFGMQLTVNISGQIDFRVATGNTSILCDAVVQSVLRCSSWGPLGEDAAVRIRLQFLADTVPLTAENKVIRFEVKVMPYDSVENPEMNAADNVMTLESRTAIVADLNLDGWADPRQLHVQDSDQSDVTLTHKLLVVNRGDSFLPATRLLVRVPFIDSTGADMLRHSNVTIKRANGEVVECPHHLGSEGLLEGSSSTATTTTTLPSTITTTAATTGSKTSTSLDNPDDPFGSIDPSRRRRRQAEDVESDEGRDSNDGKVLKIDCLNSACRVYQCDLPDLQRNYKAEINVTVTIRRSAINFPGTVDTLHYTVTTNALEPKHPLFYPWKEERRREVRTLIKRVSSGDEINIWIIIGGVIGGLILLIIIAVVAWRLGFFARNDKAKLERLKRQSGFYENKGSVKSRKSQRPPSSSSSGAQK
uniref:Integrin alpha 1 n=1 Tax=Littorina littorea TaxID=31216 RepID=A0A2P1L4C0_LITLI|nr:integrin alpha 1 [Littorina littorea]